MLVTYRFSLPDITCPTCVGAIEKALSAYKAIAIQRFAVKLIDKTLTVVVKSDDRSPSEVKRLIGGVIDDIGFECVDLELPVASPASPSSANTISSRLKRGLRAHWFLGALGVSAGLALLILSLVMGALPLMVMVPVGIASVVLTLVLGIGSYKDAAKKLFKARTLTMDSLFAMSTLTIIGVSLASFFVPWLPMMFEAGLLIYGFRHIGIAIEESIKKTMALNMHFKDRLPVKVNQVINKKRLQKLLTEIQPGDILLIQPGELIPVDGICELEEKSLIMDTIVTGSTLPRSLVRGEPLLAGMSLAKGTQPIHLKVTSAAKQSYLARLDNQIASANDEKAPLETTTTKILNYFIPMVMIVALISGLLISHFFTLSLGIYCAVSVLVSACPCTLGFLTPLAVKIGMQKAAANGVQFKSEKILEEAAKIDAVVFDLNGTLTMGVPVVRKYGVMPDDYMSAQELLAYFAVLEKDSPHPMAKAICKYIKEQEISISPDLNAAALQTSPFGLTAVINEACYTLGNQTMMNNAGIEKLQHPVQPEEGDTIIYLARAKKVVGYVILTDPLRPDARYTVDALKQAGKTVYLCTGADEATAGRYAQRLGISPANIKAGCMGAAKQASDRDKKTYIDQLKTKGHRVAMIGDAANDAVAITASHFGIAVKSRGGDEMTQQQAGAVIQSGSLLPVVSAFAVAKQTVSNIKQNLLMSLGYNVMAMLVAGGLLLAVGVVLNPGVGVALMILQSSLILFNAYRFKQQKLAHLNQTPDQQASSTSSYRRLQASLPTPAPKPNVSVRPSDQKECLIRLKKPSAIMVDLSTPLAIRP